MRDGVPNGSSPPAAPRAQPPPDKPRRPTGREARRKRRATRRRGEEILAWFLVPLILLGLYWGITAGFDALGTTPGTVWDQLMQAKQALQKRA